MLLLKHIQFMYELLNVLANINCTVQIKLYLQCSSLAGINKCIASIPI